MRVLGALLLGVVAVSADTIVLKNGRRIVADRVTEQGQRITYETEQGAFTLPKSIVARVEQDGALPAPRSSTRTGDAPLPSLPLSGARPEHVVVDGRVDRRYLEELARQPALSPAGRELMVASFLAAVEHEMNHGRLDAAMELARRGADAAPGDARMLMAQAAVLMQRQELRQAREVLLRARPLAGESAEFWKFLGFVDYSSDRLDDAIKSWKKSLSLAPDAEVERMLERARRETAAEERFLEAATSHFTLRFEGRQVSTAFSRELLDTLESLFRDLERDLGVSPREPITVILYANQAFRDVTQAPSWTGALFDGKVRVPVEGLEGIPPELRSVLKHEMTHSFVRARARGRCPAWLNEGLAQLQQGKSSAPFAGRLLEIWKTGKRLPLAALEEPFLGMETAAIPTAYATSLAAVEMLQDRYSLFDLGLLLDRLAAGASVDAALRAVLRLSYEELEEGLPEYLQKKTR